MYTFIQYKVDLIQVCSERVERQAVPAPSVGAFACLRAVCYLCGKDRKRLFTASIPRWWDF